MAEEIQKLKGDRTAAKLKVTVSAKRLKSAIERGSSHDCISKFLMDLEECVSNFEIIHEEFCELVQDHEEHQKVNGLGLVEYRQDVLSTYQETVTMLNKKTVSPSDITVDLAKVSEKLSGYSTRLTRHCEKIEQCLAQGLPVQAEALLDSNKDESDQMIAKLYEMLSELNTLLGSDKNEFLEYRASAYEIIDRIDCARRDCKLLASQMHDKAQAENVQRVTQADSVTGVKSPDFVASEVKPMVDTNTANGTFSVAGTSVNTNESDLLPVQGAALGGFHKSNGSQSGARQAPDFSTQTLYSGGVSQVNSHQGLYNLPQLGNATLPNVSLYATGNAHVPQNTANVFSSPSTFATLRPTARSYVPQNSVNELPFPPTSVTLPDYGTLQRSNFVPTSNAQSFNQFSSDVHLKKISLPVFSGERKDWPEFRAVWKELAENSYQSKSALAYELKRSLKGNALDRVKHIYVTRADSYDLIWERLSEHYDDTTACVQAALDGIGKLKAVSDGDYRALVSLVDTVEETCAQLEQLDQLHVLTMRDVDRIADMLPSSIRSVWNRTYHGSSNAEKLSPIPLFAKFLMKERAAVLRLAENQRKSSSHSQKVNSHMAQGKKKPSCIIHPSGNHKTAECRDFQKLDLDSKYKSLREAHACFKCFGSHRRDKCKDRSKCEHCNKTNHPSLLCRKMVEESGDSSPKETANAVVTSSHTVGASSALSLYAIQHAVVVNSGKEATIFCDNGSNSTYITHRAAQRHKAMKLEKYSLEVTTMGNQERTYDTCLYEMSLRTVTGKIVPVRAFGMTEITGPVSLLDEGCLSQLFPDRDSRLLQRKSTTVDLLLGCDYFSLHPKKEVTSLGNLSIMQGELGVCVQGSHPNLQEDTRISLNMVRTLHEKQLHVDCNHISSVQIHPEFNFPRTYRFDKSTNAVGSQGHVFTETECMSIKSKTNTVSDFILGEELSTLVNPRCGSCKCGKCPSVGHTYSFREEQELKMIRANLHYDELNLRWVTKYPWVVDPCQLPDNYSIALATLMSTERSLAKDKHWATLYAEQIQDMVDRGVARKLSTEELASWDGPTYYISHLAVCNQKSQSTPIRIVFNSSQKCKGTSLNEALAKGPDGYMNNLMGLLLRWREEQVAVVGDIRKMFHSVHLMEVEQHCHRFLWRDMDNRRAPDVYIMLRVNMGDKPAPAICTEAIYLTAEKFRSDNPRAAEMLRNNTYVDDLVDSFSDKETAYEVLKAAENMLYKGGFQIKCWQLSGNSDVLPGKSFEDNREAVPLLKGEDHLTRVLGVCWHPNEDLIVFGVTLNFSKKRRGERTGPSLTSSDVPNGIPEILTRRMVLEQVMSIFDPLGLLSPFTLYAKLYLRETWEIKLGWDDPLPTELRKKWIKFFSLLFEIEDLQFERHLHPPGAVGEPWLVLLSDGSDKAYGVAAYIRWQLENGLFWAKLIMAKCRIAPMAKLTTPQMELNGAVISKRARKVIETEMRFKFERILQIVDSETVLMMLHKTSTRFKVYEGVRIGEVQSATGGDMRDWAWISGRENVADWLTRGRSPVELGPDSEWWRGPSFLYQPVESWGLKFGLQGEDHLLPGEKKLTSTSAASAQTSFALSSCVDFRRFSCFRKVCRVVARIVGILRAKSFKGGSSSLISPDLLHEAENLIVEDAQMDIAEEVKKRYGRYSSLHPEQNSEGLWIVGSRLKRGNPMTHDGDPQMLLPSHHPVSRLIMKSAHEQGGHRGRDATLARFRLKYWVPHGSKLAGSVKSGCQLCKLREPTVLQQKMGLLPKDRLKPTPPFSKVMLDLFGPYQVRGEVQKRISGKAYGVIFTDLVMRAVHIEAAFGYDTSSFLLALSRFVSIRGWPDTLYSDPGSQLVGAERELKNAWLKVDRTELVSKGAEHGLRWNFGPADSPWCQGAVESLVKSAKRSIHFAVGNRRMSPGEFLTVCAEVSNLLNERPIGSLPAPDSDINVLTPNSLLLGRATAKNPGGWQPQSDSLVNRYHFVQSIVDSFWKRWVELCAPALIVDKKWHTYHRNLVPGDIVIVCDQNSLRGEYRLGKVREVFPGTDGKVRKVSLSYKNLRCVDGRVQYVGESDTVVVRSVQRLALLVPVESSKSHYSNSSPPSVLESTVLS